MNKYSTIARLNAPINQLSQSSKIDIPRKYIYIFFSEVNVYSISVKFWDYFLL